MRRVISLRSCRSASRCRLRPSTMNFRTTLLLLVLVAAGGATYYYQDTLAARLGFAPPRAGLGSPTLEVIEGSHSLSIAMNQADVESIRQQCERALKKSALARDTIARLPLRVTISGSDDYEPR